MCGIVAYTGTNDAVPILLAGLKSLEYRGYDSAGIAVVDGRAHVAVARMPGRVEALVDLLESRALDGSSGIGHTRWATHGEVNEENCHPHTSGEVAIVHNGIVENYLDLREELTGAGYEFTSQTDSEVIAHLVHRAMKSGASLEEAVRQIAHRLEGAAAIVATCGSEPGKIVGLRLGNAGGIVVGFGDHGNLLASDLLAILPHTNRVAYVENGEIAVLTPDDARFMTVSGRTVVKDPVVTQRTAEAAAKGDHPHFMLKEIREQPEALLGAMRGRVDFDAGQVVMSELPFSDEALKELNEVVLLGMGSSLHAAMLGGYLLEPLARIPVRVENASEFRYREPVVGNRTLVVAITQSGETADTLAAMELAKAAGARQLVVTEAEGSQATRLADGTLLIRSGQEIGVAATKTMTNTVLTLYLLALHVARARGTTNPDRQHEMVAELASLPKMFGQLLDQEGHVGSLATRVAKKQHLLYLGRGATFPAALEGALKMKEIAYIHAEGYAAGEMKHGVNALISDAMPTIALAPQGPMHDKLIGNINEVKARGGEVIAVITEGDSAIAALADETIVLPPASPSISALLSLGPMQLLAYHAAVLLGHDPDKPRNLAKTVTVE